MAKRKPKGPKQHAFGGKLLLNQWLVSLFGIDPLAGIELKDPRSRPFHRLAEPFKDPALEGMDPGQLHRFYHALVDSDLFRSDRCRLRPDQVLAYEENIVRHTLAINAKRHRPVVWKYFQWLSLLFVEIYLDRFFRDRERLLADLNAFVERFNLGWRDYADVPGYSADDLNKLCIQNATGSGKTLLMHVNLLQYRHYAETRGRDKDLSRIILLTPNERLSAQHVDEFMRSGIFAEPALLSRKDAAMWRRVDVVEITKLADQDGPNTIAARNFGDNNLLLVDEGHRGMSGKEEGVWLARRSALCAKGFSFEYSATFEQAAAASGNAEFENGYARAVLFDYSYRWFYEDGFGKDYQILNLPESFEETQTVYITACLLKYYQQLRIYQENAAAFAPFHLEKPLWVFAGSTVSGGRMTKDERMVATDVACIVRFIADFLDDRPAAVRRISEILTGGGRETGLLDKGGNDIFDGAFAYLARATSGGETVEDLYRDILARLFNNPAGGHLTLSRIKGDSGEVALRAGTSETPFGLINVGDAKSLCDHAAETAARSGTRMTVEDSDFTEAMFASVKDSTSPVHLLVGSKKFVEGWDCWRVSTLGLMHVGRSEGAQIIQLFGRGVRLKGYGWRLKRSGRCHALADRPPFIEELETLNVFGIEADFMEKFREFLKAEGLPGNERRKIIRIPLNVTYDFGKKLKILRPKRKPDDGEEYDFQKDGPVPVVGDIPAYLTRNPVEADWYSRIQTAQSRETDKVAVKEPLRGGLPESALSLLDFDALFFELERFKRERGRNNLNISKAGIRRLLQNPSWYTLYLPDSRLNPADFDGVRLLQQVAAELLKRYCDHYYNYRKREYLEPRLELRDLDADDTIWPPREGNQADDPWSHYQLVVEGDAETVIRGIERLKKEIEEKRALLTPLPGLKVCNFGRHLFQPLFHMARSGKITVLPVALNKSEYQFVVNLKTWYEDRKPALEKAGVEIFLLRNMNRGKGVGFFEAGNFHPDFILWMLADGKQYVTFIEPHGLLHEGPASEKILFHERIKEIEKRLNDPDVVLNSFILSWTEYAKIRNWGKTKTELEDMHILFMNEDNAGYIGKLFDRLRGMME